MKDILKSFDTLALGNGFFLHWNKLYFFSNLQNPNTWNTGTIKFKGGIFAIKKIKNRLFVFCPKVIYEIVKKKDGFKKVKVCPNS